MTTTVSASRQLVFVHIAKSGGISTSKALQKDIPLHPLNVKPVRSIMQAVRDTGVVDPFRWTRGVILPEHATVGHLERVLSFDISHFFVFGTVRNPWERELSEYFYLTRQMKSRFIRREYWRYRGISFKDTLRLKMSDADNGSFLQQIDHFRRQNGDLLLSDYCRFESLPQDYARIAEKLGLTAKNLPHLNSSRRRDISEYYDKESQDIVKRLYRDDIEYFGYAYPRA